ncbi:glucose-1-phosphate cytidylyltransferase [Candidatus Proelusimicrobium excrementi]|uniref:glucose-1-phosphate cytidylyltransferase n=1 Tax=Candidatus Proelusimicrobium excrementi TaxID=3416222 RepID=UPI003C823C9E|nr:glucose-1-phosphate cytidylyltransferase [Elusimicrobiaceae bacterium]
MKAVILAGGLGTRISEESHLKPKPMIEIGGKPILWHIMKMYSAAGVNEFIILAGYKSYVIKEYFADYFLHNSDLCIDLRTNTIQTLNHKAEPWKVTILDTGLNTMTGGRIKQAENFINGETFLLTYGDGVSDVNMKELISYHKKSGKLATVTTVQPEGRFGAMDIGADGGIKSFKEKPKGDGGWINAGFFVLEPEIFKYLPEGDLSCVWEREPLEKLAKDGQLQAFKHEGFWKPMDALRDKNQLEELWASGKAPWKVW